MDTWLETPDHEFLNGGDKMKFSKYSTVYKAFLSGMLLITITLSLSMKNQNLISNYSSGITNSTTIYSDNSGTAVRK